MESAKQKVRAAAARQKEEKRAKEVGGRPRQPLRLSLSRQRGSPMGVTVVCLKRPPSLLGMVLQRKNHLSSQAMVRVKG